MLTCYHLNCLSDASPTALFVCWRNKIKQSKENDSSKIPNDGTSLSSHSWSIQTLTSFAVFALKITMLTLVIFLIRIKYYSILRCAKRRFSPEATLILPCFCKLSDKLGNSSLEEKCWHHRLHTFVNFAAIKTLQISREEWIVKMSPSNKNVQECIITDFSKTCKLGTYFQVIFHSRVSSSKTFRQPIVSVKSYKTFQTTVAPGNLCNVNFFYKMQTMLKKNSPQQELTWKISLHWGPF